MMEQTQNQDIDQPNANASGLPSRDPTGAFAIRAFGRRHQVAIALFLVLSLALSLRLYGINWDQGGLFHPDERAILFKVNDLSFPSVSEIPDLLDADKSTLNPKWFSYGSLPIYLLKTTESLASPFIDWDIFDLRYVGRSLSAITDTATIAMIFLLAQTWLSKRTALLASLLAALSVISIQLSHFFTVDVYLTLFGTSAIYFMLRYAHYGHLRHAALAGALVGLAIATKASALILIAPLGFTFFLFAISQTGDQFALVRDRIDLIRRVQWAMVALAAAIVALIGVLIITQPYMFLDWGTYQESVTKESEMVRRIIDFPYTRQYVDTQKYLYQFWQLGTYGLGPALGMFGWAALAAGGIYTLRTRRKFDLIIFSYLVPYLLVTGWFEVKFLRYMLPLVPFLVIYSARLLEWTSLWIREYRPNLRFAVPAVTALLLAATVHYALSYETIYASDHPAQQTSQWFKDNAPQGSLILKEHWEEGIPGLPQYFREEMELYNPDIEFKFTRISSQLSRADYIVFYSNRLFATLPRLEERYPISTIFYERLFTGALGYELVHTASSVPSLLGVAYDDDTFGRTDLGEPNGYEGIDSAIGTVSFGWADESFYVYDHPKTLVFQNIDRLGQQELFQRINAEVPEQRRPIGLLIADDDLEQQRSGGTLSEIITFGTGTAWISWLVWLVAVQIIGFLALPLSLFIFKPLASRGYLLSKILGLLIVSFLAWLMASVEILTFSRGSVLVSMLILAAISAAIAWRNMDEMVAWWRENRRLILIMEALFLTSFLVFLMIRAANPDLWHPYRGGEKPMDFAYLNAVTRSTVMPPFDPWFSGGYLNYYYFGQFVVASMIRLTGVAPAVAYNLAIPMLFALTAGAVFTLVYALAEGSRKAMHGAATLARGPVIAGVVGVVFILVAGNLDGFVQISEGFRRVLFDGLPFGSFDYWRSSRMFAAGSPGNEITEFPFFTFLFADLHAHLIAIPFTLLALALAISLYLRTQISSTTWLEHWGGAVVLGLAVGALRIMNAWDWPVYLALAGGAIVIGHLLTAHQPLRWRLTHGAAIGIVTLVVSHYAYLPFHENFELFNDGIEQSSWQTSVWRYWYIHAPFMLLIIGYVAWQGRLAVAGLLSALDASPKVAAIFGVPIVGLLIGFGIYGYSTVAFTAALIVTLLLIVVARLITPVPGYRFEILAIALAIAALGIGAGVDLITVKGDIARLNTVFKFYLQAWILMGLASTYFGWRLAEAGAFSLRDFKRSPWQKRGIGKVSFAFSDVSRRIWMAGIGIVAVGIMIYPVMGTQVRLRDRFNTSGIGLDGLAYMETAVQFEKDRAIPLIYDLAAIKWLQSNVEGSPVIVEGLTDLYHLGNRVSINTGLPSIVGWDWHQRQQRVGYADAVTARRFDVDRIYETAQPDEAIRLMRKYDARFLIVGILERVQYSEDGIAKFESMEEWDLFPIYMNEEVIIYEFRDSNA